MSMVKIVDPRGWNWDRPVAQAIKVSSRGLIGNDRSDFLKTASHEFVDMIDNMKVAKDEQPVHLIALGASEAYGCFPAGTPVRMSDGTLKAIDQIAENEYVVDRLGRPAKVLKTWQKPWDGPGISLKVEGLLDNLVQTADHRFYVIKGSQVECLIDKAKHCKPDTCQQNKICSTRNCARASVSYDPGWVEAKDIVAGDYVLAAVPDRGVGEQTWGWSKPLARVIGYFLAEGSYEKSKSDGTRKALRFDFGFDDEPHIIPDFLDCASALLEDYDGLTIKGPYRSEDKHTITYALRHDALVSRVHAAVGEYSTGKRLYGSVFSQHPDIIAEMVGAYLDGDGTCPRYARRDLGTDEGRFACGTASRDLAIDLQWLLGRLGVPATVCAVSEDALAENASGFYHVGFSNTAGSFLQGRCSKYRREEPRQSKQRSFAWNGYIARPVREVNPVRLEEPVFNLEVEGDHTYTVGNGVVVHNSNRNGDGFKEATCKKYHHTFKKHARWYRNHRNKNPEKSYGYIKASAYNHPMRRVELLTMLNKTKEAAERNGGLVADKEMAKIAAGDDIPVSMACFPGDTLVRRWTGEHVPIAEICHGDRVRTHHGNEGEVTLTSRRLYAGDFARIYAYGLPDALSATENHRIWVRPALKGKTPRCPVCGKQFKSLGCHFREQKDAQHALAAANYGRYAEGWVEAGQVVAGDFVRVPIDQEVLEEGDATYAALLGLYLAEGNTWQYARYEKSPLDTYRGVDFSFHREEKELADKTIGLLHELGYRRTHVYLRKNNVRLVRVCSAELADRLEVDGGKGAWGKRISPGIMKWSPPTQKLILENWLEGDGTFSRQHQTVVGVSVSRELCRQMAEIGWRNGICVKLGRQKRGKGCDTCTIRRSEVSRLSLSKVPADFFPPSPVSVSCGHLKNQATAATTKPRISSKPMTFIENGFLYLRVRKVERFYDETYVYNMTVESDHSYTANDVGVSNCRVPYDECSGCGNKARTRDEYCTSATCKYGGCRDNLTKVAADGHILHVDNPNPNWFDISNVYRPADRIAYGGAADYLQKAASAIDFMGGAELAQHLGVTAPLNVILNQDEPYHWNTAIDGQIKLAYGLAMLEKKGHNVPSETLRAFAAPVQPQMNQEMFLLLGSPGTEKSATALAALADRKVVLPLREFARWTGKSASADAAEALLPGVFGRLVERGDLESRLTVNRYATTEKTASIAQRTLATNLEGGYGLTSTAVRDRAMRSSIRQAPAPDSKSTFWNEKQAADSPEAASLAEEYALYKLAALHRIAAYDQEFHLTGRFALAQNCV